MEIGAEIRAPSSLVAYKCIQLFFKWVHCDKLHQQNEGFSLRVSHFCSEVH